MSVLRVVSSGLSFSISFLAPLRGQKDFLLSKKLPMPPGSWKGCGLVGQARSLPAELLHGTVRGLRGQHPTNPAGF